MSGTRAVHKRTSLCELLDRFVDAQRLDIKAYSSGHLNESKLYHPPCQTQHSSWTEHNRSPVLSQTVPRAGINAKSQNRVKNGALVEPIDDAQLKRHYKLKLLKSKNLVTTVDSRHMTNAASNQILSTSEPRDVAQDDDTLDDHVPVDELCLSMKMNSMQKDVRVCDAPGTAASQLPVTRSFLSSVVPTYSKAATKKDQFRKMRNYHNNVIHHPSIVHQHVFTGSDAVKYLEHRLQEVLILL